MDKRWELFCELLADGQPVTLDVVDLNTIDVDGARYVWVAGDWLHTRDWLD